MRCLIGYFGLPRLTSMTGPSIQRCILDPLRQAGIPVLAAGHFNRPLMIDNPRSGEKGLMPQADPPRDLALDLWEDEVQNDEAIAAPLAVAHAYPDAFGDGYVSTRNLCHQLRSLDRLWALLAAFNPVASDLIMLLRPDLLYVDELKLERDLRGILAGSIDVIVPDWQPWGGLNDRFAFANLLAARAFATRIRLMAEGCAESGALHGERFLGFVAATHGLRVARTTLRGLRLRSDGRFAPNDLAML